MVEEIKRMNYFNGLFLKEEDFITDQNYNIQMRRLMNWSLNRVYGILEGLDVVPAEGKAYKVGSGVAISKSENEFGNGAEIVLPSDEYLNFSGKAPGDYYITITYNETKGDKDESKGSQEIHWIERPKIDIQSKFPDSPEKDIILAKITVPESENWKSDSKYVKADERKEIGPALRYINDKVDVKSSWIKLGQEKNGGGHLIVANNRNDEAIYLEAHNSDSNGSASSLVLSGSAAQNVKTLDARVDNTVFRGSANFEGNVGIGTANPSAKLNVDPHGKGGILVGNPNWQNGGYTSLIMEVSEEKGGYAWITSIKSSGKEPGNICFNPQYSTGNVGIGTANPSARLEVIGNIKGNNNLIIAGNVGIGTDKPDCALHVNGTRIKLGTEKEGQLFIAGENNILYLEANGSGNNNTVSELSICGNSVNNIPKLNLCADNTSFNGNINLPGTINANQNLLIQGNVGIGTTTPSAKLEVIGNIKAAAIESKPAVHEFKVLGDLDKFYPVFFMDENYWDGPLVLEINRPSVHKDSDWRGSLISIFVVHSNNWGHGADMCRAEIYESGSDSTRFIAGYQNHQFSSRFIVWLRGGGTTYLIRSNHFVTLEDFSATEKKIKINESEFIFEIKKSVESYVLNNGIHFDRNLSIDGNVGIGTTTPKGKLDVRGSIYAGNSDIYFTDTTHKHSAIGNTSGYAAIENAADFNTLMILGRTTPEGRIVTIFDTLNVSGKKNFIIDHPLCPDTHNLVHSTLEGPEVAVFYRGENQLSNGEKTILLPDYFEALTRKENRTVLITPKFNNDSKISMLAASDVKNGRFLVKMIDNKNPSQKFYWEVKAIRSDVGILEVEPEKIEIKSNV